MGNLDRDFFNHVMVDGMWQLTLNDSEKVQNTRRTSADGKTEKHRNADSDPLFKRK